MEKASETYDEREVEEEGNKFLVFFLNDDEDQSVYVEEVGKVDFFEVIRHLTFGGSVFLTHRRNPKQNIISVRAISTKDFEYLEREEEWYFGEYEEDKKMLEERPELLRDILTLNVH